MIKITIPDEVVEAAARAACDRRNGKGCWDWMTPTWGQKERLLDARAAILAALKVWPGLSTVTRDWDGNPLICLPLTQETDNE